MQRENQVSFWGLLKIHTDFSFDHFSVIHLSFVYFSSVYFSFVYFSFVYFSFQIPYAQSTTSIATDPSISDRGADRVCGRFMNIKKAQTSSQTLCSKYKQTIAWTVKFVLNLVLSSLFLPTKWSTTSNLT